MLKFEVELADNFMKVYAIGSEIKSILDNGDDVDADMADKVLELYRSRKPHFDRISQLIALDSESEGKIKANLDSWQEQLRPMLKQDKELTALLQSRLAETKKKIIDNAKGKSLMLYSKGK